MERFVASVSTEAGARAIYMPPTLADRLGLPEGSPVRLRFGLREAAAALHCDARLEPGRVSLPGEVAAQLCLEGAAALTVAPHPEGGLVLGPFIALLISGKKLAALLDGHTDTIYCRYAAFAGEAGGQLLFLSVDGLDAEGLTARGWLHVGHKAGACQWREVRLPFPRVIYDRCFGYEGREEAARARGLADGVGATVLNRPVKITKMQAFSVLNQYQDLTPYLPFTAYVGPDALQDALAQYDDLYLKPDHLYKGKGVYRLTRSAEGWSLQSREDWGNTVRRFDTETEVKEALAGLLDAEDRYLMQEGLPLATYMGNRFDFRSLVQRDGQGHWVVTGLVARIAPDGSVITSPRSGGQVATAEQALRDAFGVRWHEVCTDLENASIRLAERVDRHLGPCVELGLDMGVLQDGTVKLIEVNGKPLRVSLSRLNDPLVEERIHRFPIHFAACLDMGVAAHDEGRHLHLGPLVGMALDAKSIMTLPSRPTRYEIAAHEARAAGVILCLFDPLEADCDAGLMRAWVEQDGRWEQRTLPLPDVIYHRATSADRGQRKAIRRTIRRICREHGAALVNGANSFSKLEVFEALQFFPGTASLAPETVPFTGPEALEALMRQHRQVFVKADFGSHGADVIRITTCDGGFWVQGRFGGKEVAEIFAQSDQLHRFLGLLRSGTAWVLQQGIQLPEAEARLFDLRAIAQKDGQGRWQVPLVLVRHAKEGSVAANMAQGGTGFLAEEFAERYGDVAHELPDLVSTASEAALQVAAALEARFGQLGEIGIDIGLDREGRPWIFEANSKPLHPHLPGLPQPLIRYPLQYAAYLAERAWSGRYSGLATPLLV